MAFIDKSSTGVRGTGFRKATTRNKAKWVYDTPGNIPGVVFGSAQTLGQTLRPAPWLPIHELNKQTDYHVQQSGIVIYGGTIVGLESDGLDYVSGGTSYSGSTGVSEFFLVPANGGVDSVSEKAYSSTDTDNGVRQKGANSQDDAIGSSQEATRVAIKPNKPVGVLLANAYQNMENTYVNYDPQERGLATALRGYAWYPYATKNKAGSDAAWATKKNFDDSNTGAGGTAYGEVAVTNSNKTFQIIGVGKIIKDGPLAIDITISAGVDSSEVESTHLIDWAATRAADADKIVLATAPADVTSVLITAWTVRTAMVTAVDYATESITVDNIAFMGTAALIVDNDVLVDQGGTTHVVAAAGAAGNVIPVDTNLLSTGSVVVGSRITVRTDGSTIVGLTKPDVEIAAGDYFMSGQWGQVVKFTPGRDSEDQKLGRVYWVDPANAWLRNAAELVQTPTGLDIVGSGGTGGAPAHLYDEFGSTVSNYRQMCVNFGAK